jgi:hypothetical protein
MGAATCDSLGRHDIPRQFHCYPLRNLRPRIIYRVMSGWALCAPCRNPVLQKGGDHFSGISKAVASRGFSMKALCKIFRHRDSNLGRSGEGRVS